MIPGFVESHPIWCSQGTGTRVRARFGQHADAAQIGQPDAGRYRPSGIRAPSPQPGRRPTSNSHQTTGRLFAEYRRGGATTVEIKSGYGQTVDDELRSLAVAGRFTDETTLLAAHVTPQEYAGRPDDYVRMVVEEMIPRCAPLARWIDVFCEDGAFTPDQSLEVLRAGRAAGLTPRVHGNQLGHSGGVAVAVVVGAASVDHVVHLSDADIEALAGSDTVATLLPGADFSTRGPYPDGRRLWGRRRDRRTVGRLQPGTYTTSLSFCMALAVRESG